MLSAEEPKTSNCAASQAKTWSAKPLEKRTNSSEISQYTSPIHFPPQPQELVPKNTVRSNVIRHNSLYGGSSDRFNSYMEEVSIRWRPSESQNSVDLALEQEHAFQRMDDAHYSETEQGESRAATESGDHEVEYRSRSLEQLTLMREQVRAEYCDGAESGVLAQRSELKDAQELVSQTQDNLESSNEAWWCCVW